MSISLNYTSFASLADKVNAAMTHCISTGESVRLKNRKGEAFLLVTIHRDTLGYSFRFIDVDGRDVGHMILKAAVRCWSDEQHNLFWNQLAAVYELTEHPLATEARKDALKARKDALKAQGVTHTAKSYGGAEMHVGFQRDWLGRKRMYALGSDGSFRKVHREAFLMIAKVEAL